MDWEELEERIRACNRCGLCQGRTNAVPGEGNRNADILFIGEGPGQVEDETGRPFVGPAGQLLDKMLAAIDLSREQVYIANIVKCRPPRNRVPTDEEAAICMPYLREQFKLIRPKIIVTLGSTAGKYIIKPDLRITREHGQWTQRAGVWMLPTYHPSALLRDETNQKKREAWEDLKKLRERCEEECAFLL